MTQMKTCCRCNEEKKVGEFRRDRHRVDGRNSFCKVCARAAQSQQYKDKYSVTRAARDKALSAENRIKLNECKAVGCQSCGEKEIVCLDFHHIDPTEKEMGIAQSIHRTWKYLEAEIAKCVVVCRNCHAKIHAGVIPCPTKEQ